jgi:hypothetical protein
MGKVFKNTKLFFKDKDGKWAIVAFPNVLLAAWITIIILAKFIPENNLQHSLSLHGSAILFAWAYLELTEGTSKFRRVLGAVILLAVIISFFAS